MLMLSRWYCGHQSSKSRHGIRAFSRIHEPCEAEYFKKGSRKGQFNFAYMYFENGRRIKVNEATYNLYK